jgi:hypothetical protein
MGNIGDTRECKGNKRWPYRARRAEEIALKGKLSQSLGKAGCLAGNNGNAGVEHRHLPRPVKSRDMP